MTLELTKTNGILRFKINDDKEVIINNITREESLSYRMCVSMGTDDLAVKLID